jgi:hypothetical protein
MAPAESKIVNDPLATTAGLEVSKLPEPVSRIVSPAKFPEGAVAVFGKCKLKLKLVVLAAALRGNKTAAVSTPVNQVA